MIIEVENKVQTKQFQFKIVKEAVKSSIKYYNLIFITMNEIYVFMCKWIKESNFNSQYNKQHNDTTRSA